MRQSPLKYAIFAALLILVIFISRTIRQEMQRFNTVASHIGNFSAIKDDGSKTSYADEKGSVTLIVLSASWCPTCKQEIPFLKQLQQEMEPRGLKILMVSEDDNLDIVRKFKDKEKMTWTMVHWNYNLLNALGNPNVIPVNYVVDSKDSIRYVSAGLEEERIRQEIENAFK